MQFLQFFKKEVPHGLVCFLEQSHHWNCVFWLYFRDVNNLKFSSISYVLLLNNFLKNEN